VGDNTCENLRPLAAVPARFYELYGRPLSYAVLWRMAVEGLVPSRREGKRIFFDMRDLPSIVTAIERRYRHPHPPRAA
jgi:hypothetical protein